MCGKFSLSEIPRIYFVILEPRDVSSSFAGRKQRGKWLEELKKMMASDERDILDRGTD